MAGGMSIDNFSLVVQDKKKNMSKKIYCPPSHRDGNFVTSKFSFPHSVFKRLVLQICKNDSLFEKGLTVLIKYTVHHP